MSRTNRPYATPVAGGTSNVAGDWATQMQRHYENAYPGPTIYGNPEDYRKMREEVEQECEKISNMRCVSEAFKRAQIKGLRIEVEAGIAVAEKFLRDKAEHDMRERQKAMQQAYTSSAGNSPLVGVSTGGYTLGRLTPSMQTLSIDGPVEHEYDAASNRTIIKTRKKW